MEKGAGLLACAVAWRGTGSAFVTRAVWVGGAFGGYNATPGSFGILYYGSFADFLACDGDFGGYFKGGVGGK